MRCCVIAVAVALGAAVPALATVRDRFRVTGEPFAYAYDCGFGVEVAGTFSGHTIIREGKNADAGAFPVLDRVSVRETHTNPETGEWFTLRAKAIFNEVGATRVDGSIFEFRAVEAGQPFVVEDSDGNVVARNRGRVEYTYLFDTLGDTEPGGEFVADVDLRIAGPHPSFGVDRCEIASDLIG